MRPVAMMRSALLLSLIACGGSSSSAPTPTLSISLPNNPITSGTSVQATAMMSNGSAASNVQWSSTDQAVASVSSTGLITGTVSGGAIIRAISGNTTGELLVKVVAGPAVSINIYSGDGQSAPKGSRLGDPLCTNVKDAAGNLLIGAVVTYTVMTGAGQLAAPTAPPTDVAGIATSGLWTLGPGAGAQTVRATSPGAGAVTFTAPAQ